MKLGSLFDGSGTCPLAAVLCGIEPVWASEIEKFPIEVTTKRFPYMKHLGDITKINGKEIEPVDIITFGSPCQDLSVAGKRAGLEGERSNLFMEAIRIIREMREAANNEYPRFIMWENVPGAFSSNKGLDFRTVLEEIAETKIPMPENGKWANAGMVELSDRQIAWRVLDAQFWGVPQRRKRIFLVADFRGKRAGEILFKRESLYGNITPGKQTGQGAAENFKRSSDETRQSYGVVSKSPTITEAAGTSGNNKPYICLPINTQIALQHNALGERTGLGIGKDGDPAFTLQEAHGHGVAILNDQGGSSMNIEKSEVSPTLRSESHGNIPVIATGAENITMRDTAGTLRADAGAPKHKSDWEGLVISVPTNEESKICYGFSPDNSITAATVSFEKEKTAALSVTKKLAVAFGEADLSGYKHDRVSTLKSSGGCAGGGSETLIAGIDCRNGKENGDLCGTLQAKDGGGFSYNCTHPVRVGYTVRRLTPTECARLQGMPDWWCADIPHSDTAEYKMWGNGHGASLRVLYNQQHGKYFI